MKMIYNNSAELLVGSRQLLNNYTTIYTDIQLHNNIYRYTTTKIICFDIQLQCAIYTNRERVGWIGIEE